MSSPLAAKQSNVVFENQHPSSSDNRKELLKGLQQSQKMINPKYFYDQRGSELFEQITELSEYYPARTERAILTQYADEIAQHCGQNAVLIEPGSGSSEKIRLLLNHLKPDAYVPIDISADFLYYAALKLGEEFPWLDIYALCADFNQGIQPPASLPPGKRVVFYPGSTIGNMDPTDAKQFLRGMHQWIDNEGAVLIGVDLHKSETVLNAAYNDQQGVTADFNLNALDNINRQVNANFERTHFDHHAFYNNELQRIEMHLVSKKNHVVNIENTGIRFSKGESIHTENSYKYTLESFSTLAKEAGFNTRHSWVDEQQLFSVHYLEPITSP